MNTEKHEQLNKLYEDFKEGKITINHISNEIIKFAFLNKKEIGLQNVDEDTYQEYLIFLINKIQKTVINYNETIGPFSYYIIGGLRSSYLFWNKKRYNETAQDNLITYVGEQLMECEEELYYKDFEDSILIAQEPTFNEVKQQVLYKNLEQMLFISKNLNTKQLEEFKNTILFITVKSCYFIDDITIKQIAKYLEMDENKLQNYIEEGKKAMSHKASRYESIIRSRNNSYYYQLKYYNLSTYIQEKESASFEKISGKYNLHLNRWKEANRQLNELYMVLSPTNIAISKILDISEAESRKLLRNYKNYIDRLNGKMVIYDYENLLSKQQSKQEKRDVGIVSKSSDCNTKR